MQVNVSIYGDTTAAELNAMAAFCEELASSREVTAVTGTVTPITIAGIEAESAPVVTRKARRTKAEIAADEAAAKVAVEPEPAAPAEPEPAAEAVNAKPGEIDNDEAAAESVAAAVTTTGKVFTEADVQALATVVARAHGPDTVKDKIAELGGARIADLDAEKLNTLGAFLEAQK